MVASTLVSKHLADRACQAQSVCRDYGCTGVQVPLPFIHFIPMLWGLLACVAILPTTRYYWNYHEPPETTWKLHYLGTSWNLYDPRILLDVPYP